MGKVVLDDRAFRARLTAAAEGAMDKAAQGLQGHLRLKIGKSARIETPAGRASRIGAAKKRGVAFAKHLYQGSRPGEPPRKREGHLQRSIAYQIESDARDVVAKVGTSVPYGRHLEFGTKKMAPRPWLRSGFSEFLNQFNAIVMTQLRRRLRGR